MPSQDLETSRERFLNQLTGDLESLNEYGDFTGYWRSVEMEAEKSEDVGQLDRWLKDLRRDRDKLEALKARKVASESSQLDAGAVTAIIHRLLQLLDECERKLKRRLSMLRDMLGMWVFLMGPGVKRKPPPKGDGKPGEKDQEQTEQILAKGPKLTPKKPTKMKGT